jgi:small-conductance mechanosensitive channel
MQYSEALTIPALPFLSEIDGGNEVVTRIVMSLVLVLVLWALRVVLARVVRRKTEILSADQRRWTRTVKNLVWALIVLGLILIWAPQLRTVALSLAAFVVAIVIATKEVILCCMGAFMRVSTAPFRMGDWITIDGVCGEVVDINPFSAKLQELETAHGTYAFTGKVVQIPNSRYFSVPIENISHLKHFRPHSFTLSLQDDRLNGAELAAGLRTIIARHTADYRDEAAQVHRRVSRNSSIPLPDPAPLVLYEPGDFNNQRLIVRVYLPTRQCAAISAAIAEDYAAFVAEQRAAHGERQKAWELDKEKQVRALDAAVARGASSAK